MQVIAPLSLRNLRNLESRCVSVDLPNGGTFVTALTVFERLGLRANFLYIEQRIAMEKLKRGELDAVIVVGGKPYKSVSNFVNDGRFHLVNVDYDRPLQNDYLPATLTAKDYPNLIAEGEKVRIVLRGQGRREIVVLQRPVVIHIDEMEAAVIHEVADRFVGLAADDDDGVELAALQLLHRDALLDIEEVRPQAEPFEHGQRGHEGAAIGQVDADTAAFEVT